MGYLQQTFNADWIREHTQHDQPVIFLMSGMDRQRVYQCKIWYHRVDDMFVLMYRDRDPIVFPTMKLIWADFASRGLRYLEEVRQVYVPLPENEPIVKFQV